MRRSQILMVLAIVALSLSHLAECQEVTFGVKGGLNLSTVAYDPDPEFDIDFRSGIVVGGFVNVPVTTRLAIQPEGLFSQKGTRFPGDDFEFAVDLDYIEVPVLLQYALSSSADRTISVFAGPSLGFNVRANARVSAGDAHEEEDERDQFEDFDFGITAGMGASVGRFIIDGRYTFGLTNMAVDPELPKARHRTLTFLAGVRF
jgi:hypothetical protein